METFAEDRLTRLVEIIKDDLVERRIFIYDIDSTEVDKVAALRKAGRRAARELKEPCITRVAELSPGNARVMVALTEPRNAG